MDKPIAYIINESATEPVECKVINENGDFVVAEGILQQGEKINRNKRFYSTEDLYNEIYSAHIRELVESGNFKGEAGHPLDLTLPRQQKVDPTLEQVWYTKLWMDGPYVKAWFRGTNNELGKSFNQDLKDGQKPSFSLRSLGSIKNTGGRAQVTNLRIICYDRVYFPSYDNAYTDHIITEAVVGERYHISNDLEEYVRKRGNELYRPMHEDTITPIMNQDVIDILQRESYDFNMLCDQFLPFYKSIALTEDGNSVKMVTEDYDVIIMPLKRYVKAEIDKFCDRF